MKSKIKITPPKDDGSPGYVLKKCCFDAIMSELPNLKRLWKIKEIKETTIIVTGIKRPKKYKRKNTSPKGWTDAQAREWALNHVG